MKQLLTIAFICLCITAAAKDTTRRNLHAAPRQSHTETEQCDTLNRLQAAQHIVITGYEKPLRSTKETVMIHLNEGAPDVRHVIFDIEYNDLDGKQLHKRTVELPIDITPGGTRMYIFKSWDVNKVFYYHLNTPPRTTAQGTPYTIKLDIRAILIRQP